MAINPPAQPEDDDPDTPKWVKSLFGRLADRIEAIDKKVSEQNVPDKTTSEGESSSTDDKPAADKPAADKPADERKPRRKRSWIFRDE